MQDRPNFQFQEYEESGVSIILFLIVVSNVAWNAQYNSKYQAYALGIIQRQLFRIIKCFEQYLAKNFDLLLNHTSWCFENNIHFQLKNIRSSDFLGRYHWELAYTSITKYKSFYISIHQCCKSMWTVVLSSSYLMKGNGYWIT